MPIQWYGRLTGVQQLSGIIAGEAAGAPGQFAVASVIYNRMRNANGVGGYLGAGSNDPYAVVTPTQFNGFTTRTTSYSDQLAADIMAGRAPTGGDPGNAVYFAAQDPRTTLPWAAPGAPLFATGTNISGNYYSDQQGAPTANFQAPSYGAHPLVANGGTNDPQTAQYAADAAGYAAADSAGYSPSNNPTSTDAQTAAADKAAQNISEQYAAAGMTDPSMTVDPAIKPNTAGTTSKANPKSQSIPQAIDHQTQYAAQDTSALAAATLSAANSRNQADIAAANASDQTYTGIFGGLQSTATNLFIRGTFIGIGLILVAAGLWHMMPSDIKATASRFTMA